MRLRSHVRVVIDREASSATLRPRRRRPSKVRVPNEEEAEEEESSSFRNLPPVLRRAGSSTTLSFSSSLEEDEYGLDCGFFKHEEEEQTDDGSYFYDNDGDDEDKEMPKVNKQRHFSLLQRGTIISQVLQQGIPLMGDFQSNGLPWDGMQCRSTRAGLTGAFFAIPALVVVDAPYEQAWWVLQAVASVMADYFNIHCFSVWHGIDRIVAQVSLLGLVGRGLFLLQWWAVTVLVIFPVSCFVAASAAKDARNLNRWHNFHFLWHIVASIACTLGVYLTYRCPTDARDSMRPEFLQLACLPNTQ